MAADAAAGEQGGHFLFEEPAVPLRGRLAQSRRPVPRPEVPHDLVRGQVPSVDGRQVIRSHPRPVRFRRVAKPEGRLFPVFHAARNFRLDGHRAIHENARPARAVPGEHEVGQFGRRDTSRRREPWRSFPVGLRCAKPRNEPVAFLAEQEISLVGSIGHRQDRGRAVLVSARRLDPRLERELAADPNHVGNLGRSGP